MDGETKQYKIVPFNEEVHRDEFYQMNLETLNWHGEELLENYQFNAWEFLGKTSEEFTKDEMEPYLKNKPPDGINLILEVEGKAAGMLAIWKISDGLGEVHRMWIRPEYRGNGYSKPLLAEILEKGREFGFTTFRLSTPRFAHAAQHLYRSTGFKDSDDFRDVSHPVFRDAWICMEKKNRSEKDQR